MEPHEIDALLAAAFRDRLREMTVAALIGHLPASPQPSAQPDLMADLLAAKAAIAALPPVLQAVKLHPADVARFRHAADPMPHKTLFGPWGGLPLFRDVRVPRGTYRGAFDRATVDAWILEEWREHLLDVLRWRIAAAHTRRQDGE